jgi:putative flippase GtrA
MVRANRPWRFAARLYRALAAALAVGAYGVLSSDIWRLSDAMGWWRLTAMCAASVVATIVAIIVVHRLWEHAPDPRVRDQVVLFNIATTVSVVIGIASLYAALFVLVLAGAELVVSPEVLANAIGHKVQLVDYLSVAWFVASFSTVAGGLGAGLESDEAIREAAYSYTPDADEMLAQSQSAP